LWVFAHALAGGLGLLGEFALAARISWLVDQIPALRGVVFGAPAVICSRRMFLRVSDGCWGA
jgi:hypothetical protein